MVLIVHFGVHPDAVIPIKDIVRSLKLAIL